MAVPEQSLLAGGDLNKRYFLNGPKDDAADAARPLLLVMPGGDGSADFKPFVTNIWRETADADMLVAQLVAPRWSPEQFEQVVWPTNGLAWEGAAFTTEEFVAAVVDDIDARYDVDRSRVWILAWSSGGPAAYASLLSGPATGAFVAMSVFKPDQLGDLSRAAGKSVYILHSPEDFIAMSFPQSARDTLGANGATTKLQTYKGGHGWHGDVFGMIRDGLAWLEDQVPNEE
jgi:poly(3-hydroxybutyrate) depolymerase